MTKAAALASLGIVIAEAGKGGDAFGPIVTLAPMFVSGQPLAAEIDALAPDVTTAGKAAALEKLVGIIGDLLTNPKYAAATKAALKGLISP